MDIIRNSASVLDLAVNSQPHGTFAERLIAWQKQHGRHDLPWQKNSDPYRVWLSEIMLQQTQVSAVISYYQRFLERFPNIKILAAASEDDVLAYWSGLGYYSRARNLHAAAKIVIEKHHGIFPTDFEDVLALPGIGRSTAGAISAFAFGQRRAILDGNVKRVFARQFGIDGYPGEAAVSTVMWKYADTLLPYEDVQAYTQGLMDMGATLCTRSRPACGRCPVADTCVALATNRVIELPHRKPAKILPLKKTVMLILQDKGEILLEKRPSVGIWGGLWCFPEIPLNIDIKDYCLQKLKMETVLAKPLPILAHGFTHYLLEITPQPAHIKKRLSDARLPGQLWIQPEDALQAAIPTPVRKLLMSMSDGPLFSKIKLPD